MGFSRFWRIDSDEKKKLVLRAVGAFEVDFARHPMILSIEEERVEKSHDQRKAWHALLAEFGREVGYTRGQMKSVVKRELLGSEWVTLPGGRRYEIEASSEAEDRYGYSELIENTIAMAGEMGIRLEVKRKP